MTVKELNIGDVFRVIGEAQLWRKTTNTKAERVGTVPRTELDWYVTSKSLKHFAEKELEVVERADTADIRRMNGTLILKGGEVTLRQSGTWQVLRCTPGETYTEFVLTGSSFYASAPERLTEDSAIAFYITLGSKHLNRPNGSELFAYKGRVYGRATQKEVLGKAKMGGYKIVRNIDGAKRLIIAGVLTLPGESALYDIIMEYFGPDTVRPVDQGTRPPAE